MPDLSIVIPAYDEAACIEDGLRSLTAYFAEHPLDVEIIVVDDGSKDGTGRIVRNLTTTDLPHPIRLVERKTNGGKGAAVRDGMLTARGEARLFLDADMPVAPDEVGRLLAFLETAHVVIASRAMTDSHVLAPRSALRRVLGWGFRKLLGIAGLGGIRDSQCGLKLFRAEAAQAIFGRLREEGFAFDVEVLALARHLGFTLLEKGITLREGSRSSVDLLRDPARMFLALLRIRRRMRGGAGDRSAP